VGDTVGHDPAIEGGKGMGMGEGGNRMSFAWSLSRWQWQGNNKLAGLGVHLWASTLP
jgi:hypothetical protein